MLPIMPLNRNICRFTIYIFNDRTIVNLSWQYRRDRFFFHKAFNNNEQFIINGLFSFFFGRKSLPVALLHS
ncbi:hypothetical protein C1X21_13855 [Pseudomonas sp. FW305-3-2-15-A-LB2]|nr:hypothetical protein C1X17_16690 [Pseudomonas sp. FW305-3-2-15-C-TSA2]PMV28395.1 hypothetical protein C1X22_14715 [Pseudomonas sp. DP16D-L5]PMV38792.1 hypothetical protein C1X21_13855 [Pseudomonas sp. FW305-3-2-15-A-LB2]PMV43924.1 hypothetical protein C1X16_18230 [Pseudomonas sp. FW305-3-2-15-C-R2A1]PMV51017.1 hypothetical protein C1X18_14345 [Pseudomonas sp. FW305-3-2-15-C-LB1]PMV56804.1 hypothetical protein C1X19_11965 [Pseudomonas sp. GW460-4]PMV62696.1 hypothetical protein C1X20_14215 